MERIMMQVKGLKKEREKKNRLGIGGVWFLKFSKKTSQFRQTWGKTNSNSIGYDSSTKMTKMSLFIILKVNMYQ